MFEKIPTRRQFLGFGQLAILFLLNSCSNSSKKIIISLLTSFYPKSLKDTLPASWQQEDINFGKLELEKNKKSLSTSDFILINDGWINSINFENFQNINYLFPNEKFDKRSEDFLNSFQKSQSNKLLPIGIVPYAVIIKNNKDLIYDASKTWDFLLEEKLKGKIIFPQSPRIIMSIAQKISVKNSLTKLKEQAMLFEDQNALNWLINSSALVAIMPYTLCIKYLNFDSRLSIVFPNKGVPLIWNFILSKSKINNQILIEWIESLEKRTNIEKLASEGWYLPFKNEYSEGKYNFIIGNKNFSPSKECWKNSWSFLPIDDKEKVYLEKFWKQSLAP